MTTLSINNVSVRFPVPNKPPVQALAGVDCTMESGDFTVAIGASGCGKTTLLKLLAGFIAATEGDVLLNGEPIEGPGRDRGVVFQKHALLPWMNVTENVAFGPKLRGRPKRERIETAMKYLRMVHLEDSSTQPVYKLSGGMQQRVGLARALANDPEVLLMDEPLGALDAFTREVIQSMILDIWSETSKTVFFITHSVEEALFMGNKLLIMCPSPGRVVETREFDFCYRYLKNRDARAVKSDPEFIEAREEVVSTIHNQSPVH
jgi:taurine transport system ATP-binding protein